MRASNIADLFDGVATKTLVPGEIDPNVSHQHEFNGNQALRLLLGEPSERALIPTTLFYFSDEVEAPLVASSELSWYDTRRNQPRRHAEWRLYFPDSPVTEAASAGDILTIARLHDGDLIAIISPNESTFSRQIQWVFGEHAVSQTAFQWHDNFQTTSSAENLVQSVILEALGIELESERESHLDEMVELFGNSFPTTKIFSAFARSKTSAISPLDDPDKAIVDWIAQEESMFRALERHLVSQRLADGFENDVDGFISYSLSIQNRRKSRMGHALENHLETLFNELGIVHTRKNKTEHGAKPDFLFPGLTEYLDPAFPTNRLTMLGAKSTSKDRWRQVLSEADRIIHKHLITLEPAISSTQTNEMRAKNLQLVVPQSIAESYTETQQDWLMNIQMFVDMVRNRQSAQNNPDFTSPNAARPR